MSSIFQTACQTRTEEIMRSNAGLSLSGAIAEADRQLANESREYSAWLDKLRSAATDRRLDELAADEPPTDEVAARRAPLTTATPQPKENTTMAQHTHKSMRDELAKDPSFASLTNDQQFHRVQAALRQPGVEHVVSPVPSAVHAPSDPTGGMLSRAAKRASFEPSAPSPGAVDVTGQPGRNTTERTMAHIVASNPAAKGWSHDQLFTAACTMKRAGQVIDKTGAQ